MSKITFATIQLEKNVDELYRIKHTLVNHIGALHQELHSGNSKREKSEILGDINEAKDLEDYAYERIKVQRHEDFIANKEKNSGLRKFKELARAELRPDVFARLERESKMK